VGVFNRSKDFAVFVALVCCWVIFFSPFSLCAIQITSVVLIFLLVVFTIINIYFSAFVLFLLLIILFLAAYLAVQI